MIIRYLSPDDLFRMEKNKKGTELAEVASEYACLMLKGEKVLVKEKTTARGTSIVFYRYNDKGYRYQPVGEFIL